MKKEMKKLLLVCMLSTSVMFAQQKPVQKLTAGDQLIKAKNHLYLGSAMAASGVLLNILGANQNTISANGSNDNAGQPVIILGAAMGFIGSVLIFESFSHLGKAGKLMNENKPVAFGITKNGPSLIWRF